MADEPRRSGRATKGQHKNLDLIQEMPSKKPRTKAQSKEKSLKPSAEPTPAPSEEEEIIRCICGEYEEEEDIERDMICCDRCSAWQHNDCMGLTFAKGEEPDEYYCELCKPEDHKVLLDKIAQGERPWEEVARRRQQEIEEKKAARRKKGKKGKRGGPRQSDVKSQASLPSTPAPVQASPTPATVGFVASAASQTPAEDNKSPVPSSTPAANESKPISTQKRKFDEHKEPSMSDIGPKQKQQRLSESKVPEKTKKASPAQSRKTGSAEPTPRKASIAERPLPEIAQNPEDIQNDARKKCTIHLVNLFVDQIAAAQKQGSYSLPADKQAEDVARPIGLSIEHAMYTNICGGSGDPNELYRNQLRTITFNVKKNSVLRDRLLTGGLAPTALATMSSQDMASEEQQQKDAEIKREAEKQHIIMQEQGPRIRRTHKGEEVVEGDGQAGTSESIFSSTAVHRAAAEVENAAPQSPIAPGGSISNSQHPPEPSVVEMNHKVPAEKAGGLNGDSGRSHSPGPTNHDNIFPEVPAHLHQPPPPGDKVQADEEIDKLLKDGDTESPPYSPKDFQAAGEVWRGTLSMIPVAEFGSTARHVAGADLNDKIPWSQLVPPTLVIDGRIAIELASKYLCGLRFSNSTDVSVIAIPAPDSPKGRIEFDKLFKYFTDRKRYGVVGKHPVAAVKDTYIIPIEAGANKKPEFLQLLENNSIEDPTPEPMFLVVFVVKTNDRISEQPTPHHAAQDKDHPMVVASPLGSTPFTQHHAQYASPSPATRQGSQATPPMTMAASEPSLGNAVHPHSFSQQGHNVTQQQSQVPSLPLQVPPPLVGAAAAAHVLGPQAKSPAIEELLQKAPSADVAQLNIVREIITKNPSAANDYPSLMSAIQQYTSSSQNGQQGSHA